MPCREAKAMAATFFGRDVMGYVIFSIRGQALSRPQMYLTHI